MLQLALICIVLAAALVLFLWRPETTARSGLLLWGMSSALSLCIFGAAASHRQLPPDPGPEPAHDPPREVASDGYVGSSACRSYHPHEHATWHSSWHRTMTQLAQPGSTMANMDDVTIDWQDVRFRIKRDGDEFLGKLSAARHGRDD